MRLKLCASVALAAAIALTAVAAPSVAMAENQKKRTVTTKKIAKRPVPVTMAAPRARITVQRRSYLDPGREIIPGSQREFTDYAFPPGYSPTSVIENRAGVHRSPLPGPFDLPGRDNPWPWNWCSNC